MSPYPDLPDGFLAEKNAATNAPVWLYRIQIDDTPTNDLFLAESDADVSYFKDVSTAQTYTAFPITHAGIGSNLDGEVDQLNVTVANVNLLIQAYLEQNAGLRGNKVTVRLVFRDALADPTAHIESVFYIDSAQATAQSVSFTLTSKMDLLNTTLPRRTFADRRCQWAYKGLGCWLDDDDGTYTQPAGFTAGSPDTCTRSITDCERHTNEERFGAFPSIPNRRYFRI
jgi:lambda family phage minor tail protein L